MSLESPPTPDQMGGNHEKVTGLVALLSLLLLPSTITPPAARALVHDPILFVHGWNSNSSTWTTMIGRFQADGWTSAELSSRYYSKNLGGSSKIDEWVSLGGPNHGTDTAYFCTQTSCKEMRPGSTFLNNLNATDETPGTPNYRTWWSPCDSIINPDSSVSLTGAVNTQTACISHSDLHQDATVYGQVRDFVA